MNKTTSAALAALPEGCVLSLRTHPRNPNHHLWWNNGTWWLHATVHRPDYTKQRLRLPLETKHVGLARARRDTLLGAWSQEPGVRSWERGVKIQRKSAQACSHSSLFTRHSSLVTSSGGRVNRNIEVRSIEQLDELLDRKAARANQTAQSSGLPPKNWTA